MKNTAIQKPLLEWQNISLNDFMNVDIEFKPAKVMYNSFFYVFWVIGKTLSAFRDVFISDPTIHLEETHGIGIKIEKELISLFDKAYSLDENLDVTE